MNETMKKSKFTELIRSTRLEFDSLLEKFTPAQMTRAGAAGDWLIKVILAHITWHEREMIGMLEAQALRGSELWNLPLDQRNAIIHAGNKDRPLEEVRAEARQVFLSLVEKLEALSEEALNDAGHFAEMPADWQPWSVIASNTYEHYQEHLVQLQNWGVKLSSAMQYECEGNQHDLSQIYQLPLPRCPHQKGPRFRWRDGHQPANAKPDRRALRRLGAEPQPA